MVLVIFHCHHVEMVLEICHCHQLEMVLVNCYCQMAFCPGGKIIDVECATTGGMPYDQTGEIASCYPDTGFTCNTMDNFDMPCQDHCLSI
jgi:hypothetical protein